MDLRVAGLVRVGVAALVAVAVSVSSLCCAIDVPYLSANWWEATDRFDAMAQFPPIRPLPDRY